MVKAAKERIRTAWTNASTLGRIGAIICCIYMVVGLVVFVDRFAAIGFWWLFLICSVPLWVPTLFFLHWFFYQREKGK